VRTVVNWKQLWACGLLSATQDDPFSESTIFNSMAGHEFVLPLNSKRTALGITTRAPTEAELQRCPRVSLSLEHEQDPQNVCFPKTLRIMEEEVSRTVGAVRTQGEDSYDIFDSSKDNAENQLLDILASCSVAPIPSKATEVEVEVQDDPQLKALQSKGQHSLVSPDAPSERWQIGLEVAKEAVNRTTQ
jgi:hypothetical protein